MFSGWWEEGNCLTAWTLPVPHTREGAWPLQPGSGSGNTGWTRARSQRQRRHPEHPAASPSLASLFLGWHKCGLSPAYLTVTDVTSINPLPGPAATTFNIQVHLPGNILSEQSSNDGVKSSKFIILCRFKVNSFGSPLCLKFKSYLTNPWLLVRG